MINSISKLNLKIIFHFIGFLLVINGGLMLLCSAVSFLYHDGIVSRMLLSSFIVLISGGITLLLTRNHTKEIQKREGYIIVSFGWIFMALAGSLPYLITGVIQNFTDAFFETISGYTTTGASILSDIESLPKGILFWRSITQWVGGMGIIVLSIAILPLLGIGGMQLFSAESPGPGGDKLHPRITDTAKRLWFIYVGYTLVETILLKLAGMDFFDAINHSFTTLSTGGFSTKNDSVAHWNGQPLIQYIIILFMFLAGTNFVLSYFAFKTKFSKAFKDEELRLYFYFTIVFAAIACFIIYFVDDISPSSIAHPMVMGKFESAFRHGLFQVLTIITTTGFISADYTLWCPFLTVLFFSLMFLGASSGSTSGGIKVVRHLIMIKTGIIEFKKTLHPHAILPIRYNNKIVKQPIIFNILAFFIFYILSFIVGALGFSLCGLDYETTLGGTVSSLGNIGPALGNLGPVDNYSELPVLAKWWSSFLMLIGRLELFTVFILLTPFFWKN